MKRRALKTREKQCIKISTKITPSLCTMQPYNHYPILFNLKNIKHSIKVPTTLYIDENLNFLITCSETFKIQTGKEIIKKFLNLLPQASDFPVCIFKPLDGKFIFFRRSEDVGKFIETKDLQSGCFQHFVKPCGKKAAILVAYVKKNTVSKCYVFNNNIEMQRNFVELRYFENHEGVVGTQTSFNADFSFHNTMNSFDDTELSVINPYIDLCSFSKHHDKTKNIIKRVHMLENSTYLKNSPEGSYIVNLKNTKSITPYLVKAVSPEIEAMTKSIFSIISYDLKHKYQRDIEELEIIFIKDQFQGWLFLSIEAIKLTQALQLEDSKDLNPALDTSICGEINQSYISTYKSVFSPSLTEIPIEKPNNPRRSLTIKNFSDIKAKNSFQLNRFKNNIITDEKYQLSINRAVLKCEMLKFTSNHWKESKAHIKYKHENSNIWILLSSKVHKDILESPIANRFINFDSDKFYRFTQAILTIFLCEVNPGFVNMITEYHKGLMVKNREFDVYRNQFLKGLKNFITENTEIELIMLNFDMLRDAVVIV
ncbi:hypothetical protein SteCoe_38092 [Stentor coeruleus]|uniref:Uncharacterized protein n=1 Tax=Stentor coeruleus TaxID=5963 RepID=A0A1R2ALU6_9CILI|nr:hypothetical protein SteCoe_38092 [Stentor coeruleus]